MPTPRAKAVAPTRAMTTPLTHAEDTVRATPATRERMARPAKLKAAASTSVWVSKSRAVTIRNADYLSLFREDPLAQVGLVKQGVAPTVIDGLAGGMKVSKDKLLATLGLRRETIRRRAKANESLSIEESSRVLGISRLIGQVQAIVETYGNPEGFDAAAWIGVWLDRPLPALGGQRPAELMDTAEGQAVVANMILRSQSGAFA